MAEEASSNSTRWALNVIDELEQEHRATAIPQKTKSATEWGMKIFFERSQCRSVKIASQAGIQDVNTPLLQMQPKDIAYWMGKFVMEARKKNVKLIPSKLFVVLSGTLKPMANTTLIP